MVDTLDDFFSYLYVPRISTTVINLMSQGSTILLESPAGSIFRAIYRYDGSMPPVVVLVKKFRPSAYAHEDFINEIKVLLKTSHVECVPNLIAVNVTFPAIIYSFHSSQNMEMFIQE